MSATLTINCTKPGCHWSGSPADAPGHDCPTPAEVEPAEEIEVVAGNPFAGMLDANGVPVSGPDDPEHRYAVVWGDGEGKTVLIGTADDEDGAHAIVAKTETGKGSVEIIDRKPVQELAAQVAGETAETETARPAEPTTREEVEAWLLEHGDYDDEGVPLDEQTATYDARLTAILEAAGDDALEPEPELDELDETPEPADVHAIAPGMTAAEVVEATGGELQPWELQIAAALEGQTGIKDFRWLLVSKRDDGVAELIGRARLKPEAEELLVNVESRGEVEGLEIVKTKDVLDAAEAIKVERKRELVEGEPETVVQTPQEPAPAPAELEPEPEVEPAPAALAAVPEPEPLEPETAAEPDEDATGKGGGLFDANAYRSEALAIPKVDGQEIQRIALDFTGGVMLDRSQEGDVELYNRFPLFSTRELWISVRATGTGAKGATNKEGDLDVVVGRKTLKVESVRVIAPEELGRMEALEAFRFAARRALKAGTNDAALFAELEKIGGGDDA